MFAYSAGTHQDTDIKTFGLSVRCICDSLITTNINTINLNNSINLYPNPAIDRVYINNTETKNAKIHIYNMTGESVLQRELSSGTNEIDISSLTSGIYVVRLTGANGTYQQKLIKE